MNDDIEKIASYYGFVSQKDQLVEEMAELTVALNKLIRFKAEKSKSVSDYITEEYLRKNVAEEIADVQIMLWQMTYFFSDVDIAPIIEQKINRQLERMERENE